MEGMRPMTEAERKLLDWFDTEFKSRTKAVKNSTARIDWIDPGTRISWTEILSKAEELGITTRNAVEMRQWWINHRK